MTRTLFPTLGLLLLATLTGAQTPAAHSPTTGTITVAVSGVHDRNGVLRVNL